MQLHPIPQTEMVRMDNLKGEGLLRKPYMRCEHDSQATEWKTPPIP